MLPSAVFPGKNFKMGFEVTLKHHFRYMVQSTHFRLKRGHWLTSNLIPKKDIFLGFLHHFRWKNAKNDSETHNNFLYLFMRNRQKLFSDFFLFWELSFRSTIENRSVLEAIFTLFSIENHIPRHNSYHEHSKCTNIQSDWLTMYAWYFY